MRAIDIHVHPGTREYLVEGGGKYMADALAYFHKHGPPVTLDEMAALYRTADMRAVLLAWDTETTTGLPRVSNDFVADAVRKFPDVFIGFASVDPWKGKLAVAEIERAVTTLGMRGLKLHPIVQAFWPNDRRFSPLWEACVGLGIPVMFHTGTTGVGAGVPGGNGLRLKYGNPMPALDDLAAEFPGLTIIGAHPSFPWQDEMLAIAVHKTNVYIDLSGWSPKYFSPTLVQYAKSLLQDRVLFGTDYPFLSPEQWLAEFDKLGFKSEVRQKILIDNARRLLRL